RLDHSQELPRRVELPLVVELEKVEPVVVVGLDPARLEQLAAGGGLPGARRDPGLDDVAPPRQPVRRAGRAGGGGKRAERAGGERDWLQAEASFAAAPIMSGRHRRGSGRSQYRLSESPPRERAPTAGG